MFDLGVVVAVYPEGHSVDVLMDGDGGMIFGAQVMVQSGSDKTGVVDLPDVGGPTGEDRWSLTLPRERYVRALVASVRGIPVVVGFLLPQVNQVTFEEKNRRIVRHASDAYTSVDDAANIELSHPSGTYLRIGESAAHEDLTGQDFDRKWAIERNTDSAVHLQLTIKNAGTQVASLNFAPNGNVTLTHSGNLSVATDGNASVEVGGTTSLESVGAVTISAPSVTIDAPATTCTGLLTVQGGLAVSGGSGAAVSGSVTVTGGDVTADTIGLKAHRHTGLGTGVPTSPSIV